MDSTAPVVKEPEWRAAKRGVAERSRTRRVTTSTTLLSRVAIGVVLAKTGRQTEHCLLVLVQYSGRMDDLSVNLVNRIGERVRNERNSRGWSLAELADYSGVSKAMLSAVERGQTSPTAVVLVKIATAFGLTLSALIAQVESRDGNLLRLAGQQTWRDPETGYERRHLSPTTDMPLELVRVVLPAAARVLMPASGFAFIRQQIWLIEGRLDFTEGTTLHEMRPGDCLALGPPSECTYFAPGPQAAIYLVAVMRGHR